MYNLLCLKINQLSYYFRAKSCDLCHLFIRWAVHQLIGLGNVH